MPTHNIFNSLVSQQSSCRAKWCPSTSPHWSLALSWRCDLVSSHLLPCSLEGEGVGEKSNLSIKQSKSWFQLTRIVWYIGESVKEPEKGKIQFFLSVIVDFFLFLTGWFHVHSKSWRQRTRWPEHASGSRCQCYDTSHQDELMASKKAKINIILQNNYWAKLKYLFWGYYSDICSPISIPFIMHSYAVCTSLRLSASTLPTKKVSFRSAWKPPW